MERKKLSHWVALVLFVIGMSGVVFAAPYDQNLRTAIEKNNTKDALMWLGEGYYANPNYEFSVGQTTKTVLVLAIEHKNVEIVKALIQKGAKVDFGGLKVETPLMAAVKVGDVDIVRYLISLGADLNATDLLGNTALHYAAGARNANRVIFDTLLSSGALDSSTILNNAGETPFIVAIRARNDRIVAAFVDSDKFDVQKPDNNGVPPVLAAIQHGVDVKTLGAMLQKADLAPRDILDNRTNDAYYYVKQYRKNNVSYLRVLDEYQLLKGED